MRILLQTPRKKANLTEFVKKKSWLKLTLLNVYLHGLFPHSTFKRVFSSVRKKKPVFNKQICKKKSALLIYLIIIIIIFVAKKVKIIQQIKFCEKSVEVKLKRIIIVGKMNVKRGYRMKSLLFRCLQNTSGNGDDKMKA